MKENECRLNKNVLLTRKYTVYLKPHTIIGFELCTPIKSKSHFCIQHIWEDLRRSHMDHMQNKLPTTKPVDNRYSEFQMHMLLMNPYGANTLLAPCGANPGIRTSTLNQTDHSRGNEISESATQEEEVKESL